jgi:hypothetical protein
VNQLLALFNKMIRRITQHFKSIQEASVSAKMPQSTDAPLISPSSKNNKRQLSDTPNKEDDEEADGAVKVQSKDKHTQEAAAPQHKKKHKKHKKQKIEQKS